ncbi:MAG: hypothetical protein LAT68_14160 [Cyclobacteriaceae bacterium]|nr:hypothetical protein [Cyclobacteriaceae bacterium]MCH8517465.1 hypothetical protein [Cyclobacteriaceae bacterium]
MEYFEADLNIDGLTRYSEEGLNTASAILNREQSIRHAGPQFSDGFFYHPVMEFPFLNDSLSTIQFILRRPFNEFHHIDYDIRIPLGLGIIEDIEDIEEIRALEGQSIDLGELPAFIQEGNQRLPSAVGNITFRKVRIISGHRFELAGTFGFEMLEPTPRGVTSITTGRFDCGFIFRRPSDPNEVDDEYF